MFVDYLPKRAMPKLVEFDLPLALAPRIPIWLTQIGIGLISVMLFGVMRLVLDVVAPGVAPFAMIYPGIMLATLAGRWQAGVVCAAMLVMGAWYYIMPVQNSFAFIDKAGPATIAIVCFASAATIIVAEIFRRAVRNAAAERDRQVAERDLFLEEFDHRVKNNFAIVVSLLELQRRRADPTTAAALGEALMRVESIGRAHRHLYRGGDQPGSVQISAYLAELCAALADVLKMRGAITLDFNSVDALVPRDRAVSIGLVVNELVTNATKHAFHDREAGTIAVSFSPAPGGWQVVVADDGIGMPTRITNEKRDGGLGSKLVEAFARQAGGTITTQSDATGTRVTLSLAA
ncbi:MAG: hypothetical protein B7Y98_12100 [Sphingomonas sp. 32-62-10]|nr:MAG: hypothetical protein B7Y98_12100 [Sphingomonas sp. 32-62-10]